jgi:hypothetical protein
MVEFRTTSELLASAGRDQARMGPYAPEPSLGRDLLLAVPRGIADAASGLYGLADTLTGDLLPDVSANPLGRADTGLGSFAQGAVQWLSGFGPVLGGLSKLGSAGRALAVTRTASRRAIAAGVAADFAVFDGHEERLADFVQSIPGLANPVAEFFASDEDDAELIGRLKNVGEGLGIDFALGAIGKVLSSQKRAAAAAAKNDRRALSEALSELQERDLSEAMAFFENPPIDKYAGRELSEDRPPLIVRARRQVEQGIDILDDPIFKPLWGRRTPAIEAAGDPGYLSIAPFNRTYYHTIVLDIAQRNRERFGADLTEDELTDFGTEIAQVLHDDAILPAMTDRRVSFERTMTDLAGLYRERNRDYRVAIDDLANAFEMSTDDALTAVVRASRSPEAKAELLADIDFTFDGFNIVDGRPTAVVDEMVDRMSTLGEDVWDVMSFGLDSALDTRNMTARMPSIQAARAEWYSGRGPGEFDPVGTALNDASALFDFERARGRPLEELPEVAALPPEATGFRNHLAELYGAGLIQEPQARILALAVQGTDVRRFNEIDFATLSSREWSRQGVPRTALGVAQERDVVEVVGDATEQAELKLSVQESGAGPERLIRMTRDIFPSAAGTPANKAAWVYLHEVGHLTLSMADPAMLKQIDGLMSRLETSGELDQFLREVIGAKTEHGHNYAKSSPAEFAAEFFASWSLNRAKQSAPRGPLLKEVRRIVRELWQTFLGSIQRALGKEPVRASVKRELERLAEMAAGTNARAARSFRGSLAQLSDDVADATRRVAGREVYRDFFEDEPPPAFRNGPEEVARARDEVERTVRDTFDRSKAKMPRYNPRDLSEAGLEKWAAHRKDLRLDVLHRRQMPAARYLASVAEKYRDSWAEETDAFSRLSMEEIRARGSVQLSRILTGNEADGATIMATVQRMVREASKSGDLGTSVRALSDLTQAVRVVVYNSAQELGVTLRQFQPFLDGRPLTQLSDEDALRLAAQMDAHADLVEMFLGGRAEFGRALKAFDGKVRTATGRSRELMVRKLLSEAGGKDAVIEQARRVKAALDAGGSGAVGEVLRVGRLQHMGSMALEYWMNSILSGLKTFTVNLTSNAITAVWRPAEILFGGAMRGLSGQGFDVAQDALAELAALRMDLREAFQYARKAFKDERNFLDIENRVFDTVDTRVAISGRAALQMLGMDGRNDRLTSMLGAGMDRLGGIVRIPGRALQGTDEFFKQISYRAVARTALLREAKTLNIPAAQRVSWIDEQMTKMVREGEAFRREQYEFDAMNAARAAGLEEPAEVDKFVEQWLEEKKPEMQLLGRVHDRALQEARERTFTQDLHPDSFSATVQQAVIKHPLLRAFLPFVRTPINLLSFGMGRTPLNAAYVAAQYARMKLDPSLMPELARSRSRLVQKLATGDPREQADVAGQLALGAMVTYMGFSYAAEGRITGRGPADPELRQAMQAIGWQPYSFFQGEDPYNPKPGERYVSFIRLEQISLPFAVMADAMEFVRYSDDVSFDTATYLDAVMGFHIALVNQLTNRSYMQGISNLVGAIDDPQVSLPGVMRRYAGSIVPNLMGQAVGPGLEPAFDGDPVMREVRTMWDSMRSRVPGLSTELPTQRNVLGEPVYRLRSLGSEQSNILGLFSPVTYSTVSDNRIFQEFERLNHGFSPPKPIRTGYDLRDYRVNGVNAYERWMILHGEVRIGGRTLEEALRAEIDSARYQRIPYEVPAELGESPRVRQLRGIISRYRQRAFDQLMREAPELEALDRQQRDRRAALRRGTLQELLR